MTQNTPATDSTIPAQNLRDSAQVAVGARRADPRPSAASTLTSEHRETNVMTLKNFTLSAARRVNARGAISVGLVSGSLLLTGTLIATLPMAGAAPLGERSAATAQLEAVTDLYTELTDRTRAAMDAPGATYSTELVHDVFDFFHRDDNPVTTYMALGLLQEMLFIDRAKADDASYRWLTNDARLGFCMSDDTIVAFKAEVTALVDLAFGGTLGETQRKRIFETAGYVYSPDDKIVDRMAAHLADGRNLTIAEIDMIVDAIDRIDSQATN